MLSKNVVTDVLEIALSTGGRFAEVFVENKENSSISMVNGVVENITTGITYGLGLRIFVGNNALYTYTNDTSTESLIKLAKNISAAIEDKTIYSVLPFINMEIENLHKIRTMPINADKKKIVESLRLANNTSKEFDSRIQQTNGVFLTHKQDVLIANSEGLWATDTRVRSRIVVSAVASSETEKQPGSYSPGEYKGAELVDETDFEKLGKDSAKMAVTMLEAELCPSGKMPVIIGNGFGGVIFHEACGHSLEATSVAKGASVFCDKIGEKIASSVVTAVDDGTLLNNWGSINIDDEGTKSQRNVLIENGILKSYLVDRLNGDKMGVKSTGSSRRESYKYAPTSRMTNTFIANGDSTEEEIIKNTEYGLFAKKMGGGSVQPATGDFNFAVLEGYLIRNGKIAEPVRGATLIGKGSETIFNIDMVSNNLEQAAGMCGSSSGSVPTNVGQPTIRVSEMTVGGRK